MTRVSSYLCPTTVIARLVTRYLCIRIRYAYLTLGIDVPSTSRSSLPNRSCSLATRRGPWGLMLLMYGIGQLVIRYGRVTLVIGRRVVRLWGLQLLLHYSPRRYLCSYSGLRS